MSNNCVNNTRRKSTISRLGMVRSFSLMGLIVVLGFLGSGTVLGEEPDRLVLPFTIGETWYICQGYNGQISHQNVFALDLSVDPDSPGEKGCVGDSITSADHTVLAPATGTIVTYVQSEGSPVDDMVCINFDSRGDSMPYWPLG